LGIIVCVSNGFKELIRSQNEKQNDFNYLFNLLGLLNIFNSCLQSTAKKYLALRALAERFLLRNLVNR
jgi:hypothetical protein